MGSTEGVDQVFAKISGGVKVFRKNCHGSPLIPGFIAFLKTSLLEICMEDPMLTLPLPLNLIKFINQKRVYCSNNSRQNIQK